MTDQTVRVPTPAEIKAVFAVLESGEFGETFDTLDVCQAFLSAAAPSPEAEGASIDTGTASAIATKWAKWIIGQSEDMETEPGDRERFEREYDLLLASLQRPQTTAPDSGLVDRLVEALEDIERRCSEYDRLNLVGKTPGAKCAGTIRNVLIVSREALQARKGAA